jgi:2-polyprenyl-6-methoxyphenol hydroxylase-like FAD-dependent oxidoreductase
VREKREIEALMDSKTQVLIVGAGPSGLVLALALAQQGIAFRIIDKEAGPSQTSRALVVHARTLEFYRQLGIGDVVVDASQKFRAVNLWVNGRLRGHLEFGDIGTTLSKYPYSLICPQDLHERLLLEELQARGISVERECALIDATLKDDEVRCLIRLTDGTVEQCEALFLAGCDGAHSIVREKLNIPLPGGTYSHLWYVADLDVSGPLKASEVHISMDQRDVIAVFPMKRPGTARLIGQAPPNTDGRPLEWSDVNTRLFNELRTEVQKVHWFSTYRVHHRVAGRFTQGRAFLVGDAAHLHSPVGGQGMNTGIGDAFNLAWKLASVLRDGASFTLLDSYEPERRTFARGLIASTDRVFAILNSKSDAAGVFRTFIAPTFLPPLLRIRSARETAFRILSQTAINYRGSPLSKGRTGRVHAGDRLPWVVVDPTGSDNFAPLDDMKWQLHVYGNARRSLRRMSAVYRLPLKVFAWRDDMRNCGLVENAAYLIRPDGHVAFTHQAGDADQIEAYLVSQSIVLPGEPPLARSGAARNLLTAVRAASGWSHGLIHLVWNLLTVRIARRQRRGRIRP